MSSPLSHIEYIQIARFFQLMKYIHGPEFVQSTLRRHKDIFLALTEYEKRYIVDLESSLIDRSSDESNSYAR